MGRTLLYNRVKCYGHPRADSSGNVLEHIIIVEKALGKHLTDKAEVHHVNEIKTDNRNENLVICQDRTYHALLHLRKRALLACGNADWRKCVRCKSWDAMENLSINTKEGSRAGLTYQHLACAAKRMREAHGVY